MSVLDQLAYFQNRRDEEANRALARRLVGARDADGIAEIVAHLWDKNASVQSDCVKTLYEVGYLAPELIAGYAPDAVKLLRSRNNRLVWGAMITLSTIASLQADYLYEQRAVIIEALAAGSVITVDGAVATLAAIAAHKPEYRRELLPTLLNHLQTTRSKDIPQHSEKILAAVDEHNKAVFIEVLEKRLPDLSSSQQARVQRVLRQAQKR